MESQSHQKYRDEERERGERCGDNGGDYERWPHLGLPVLSLASNRFEYKSAFRTTGWRCPSGQKASLNT